MTNLERTKEIDRYLSGEMTEEEKTGFEGLLSEEDLSYNDKHNLRQEMELQKNIEYAIRERGLREMLLKEETKIKHEETKIKHEEEKIKHEEEKIKDDEKIRRIKIWSFGSGFVTALAAVILFLLVVAPVARQMQDMSVREVAEIGPPRGTGELDNALSLMRVGEWKKASQAVDDILARTANSSDKDTIKLHDNAEWLKALCLMHSGKVVKAKRLLRKIADSDSHYSIQAKEMLEELEK